MVLCGEHPTTPACPEATAGEQTVHPARDRPVSILCQTQTRAD